MTCCQRGAFAMAWLYTCYESNTNVNMVKTHNAMQVCSCLADLSQSLPQYFSMLLHQHLVISTKPKIQARLMWISLVSFLSTYNKILEVLMDCHSCSYSWSS